MAHNKYTNWQLSSLLIMRVLIGWHFLYEGMVKIVNPAWSAASFLSGSQGPFAGIFKSMAANPTALEIVNQLNQWGLVLIGLSLILGFLNRWACIGGMALMFLYYISNPPFIGIELAVSEGSYLIVNKNLIELAAILVLFLFPTEHILGLQRLFKSAKKQA